MSERENRDAARSLSVVHYMDRDLPEVSAIAAGLIERSRANEASPAFLAILPTADDVLAFSEAVLARRADAQMTVTALTSPLRAKRVLASGAPAVATTPEIVARLIAESRLDLANLHTLLLVWPEEIIGNPEQLGALEGFISEVPRSAERVACCAERSAELSQFLERAMWRAREVEHRQAAAARAGTPLRVITVPVSERTRAVRSVLDAFDPETAALLVFSDEAETDARNVANLFGPSVNVVRNIEDQRYALGILFDDVPTAEALEALAPAVSELIAVVRPSRLSALQKVAANLTPLSWTGALANARLTHDALRDEIRAYVASGGHSSWMPVLEPLLEGVDSVEVAAAALAMLDRERRKAKRVAQHPAAAPAPAPAPERPAREERSSFKSRPPRDDDRGRPDRGFPKKRPWSSDARGADSRRGDDARRGPRREFSDRGDDTRRGPRREFPDRGDDARRGPRREFSGRGEEPRRGAPDRGDDARRGPRRDFADRSREPRGRPRDEIERVPRAAREGREWSERGERLRNSRRGPRSRDEG